MIAERRAAGSNSSVLALGRGEPALKKVGVIAFIPTGGKRGRLLSIAATQQAPPGSLSLSHVLELARKTVSGKLY